MTHSFSTLSFAVHELHAKTSRCLDKLSISKYRILSTEDCHILTEDLTKLHTRIEAVFKQCSDSKYTELSSDLEKCSQAIKIISTRLEDNILTAKRTSSSDKEQLPLELPLKTIEIAKGILMTTPLTPKGKIGSGGFASVHTVDRGDEPPLVCKVSSGSSPEHIASTGRERRASSLIGSHPHILTIQARDKTAEGTERLFMEHGGKPLGSALKEINNPIKVYQILESVAKALGYMHTLGLMHLDIKPDNIMIGDDGTIAIIDLGLAESKGGHVSSATLIYAAPEIFAGARISPAMDAYALGMTIYSILSQNEYPKGLSNLSFLREKENIEISISKLCRFLEGYETPLTEQERKKNTLKLITTINLIQDKTEPGKALDAKLEKSRQRTIQQEDLTIQLKKLQSHKTLALFKNNLALFQTNRKKIIADDKTKETIDSLINLSRPFPDLADFIDKLETINNATTKGEKVELDDDLFNDLDTMIEDCEYATADDLDVSKIEEEEASCKKNLALLEKESQDFLEKLSSPDSLKEIQEQLTLIAAERSSTGGKTRTALRASNALNSPLFPSDTALAVKTRVKQLDPTGALRVLMKELLSIDPTARPSMKEVLDRLDTINPEDNTFSEEDFEASPPPREPITPPPPLTPPPPEPKLPNKETPG